MSKYIVFDIETGFADQSAIDVMVAKFKPPSNIKDPDKIEVRRNAFAEEAKQKSALTDSAPIMSVAIKSSCGFESCIHWIDGDDAHEVVYPVFSVRSEYELLSAFSEAMQEVIRPETYLAGHNVIGFDIPKIRNRMIKLGMRLPPFLMPKIDYQDKVQPVCDTMTNARYFSQEYSSERFVSFANLADSLGVKHHKERLSGAEIPMMIEQGKAGQVVAYNIDDVIAEEKVLLKMTGWGD